MSNTANNLSPNTVRVIQEEFTRSAERLRQLGIELPSLPAPNFGAQGAPASGQNSSSAQGISSASVPVSVPAQHHPHAASSVQLHPYPPSFPSIAAPPPLPIFSVPHSHSSPYTPNQPITSSGTPSALPAPIVSSTAPIPAAFRGIPPGGFPTTTVNARRTSSSGVVRNASNLRRSRAQPYESLSISPSVTRSGISGNNIDSLEIVLLPSDVEVRMSMVEASQLHDQSNLARREYTQTRILHEALAPTLHERLQNFSRIIHFSALPLTTLIHDLLPLVQTELSQRGFRFYAPYDSAAPSFSLLQLRSSGRVISTFNLPSRRLTNYWPARNETLEHIFYEAAGFRPVGFSQKLDGTHILRLVPTIDHLGGPLPAEVLTSLGGTVSPPVSVHFCSGLHLYRGLALDKPNLLHILGGNLIAMQDAALCDTCHVQYAVQGPLISSSTVGDNDNLDETESVSTIEIRSDQDDDHPIVYYTTVLAISDFGAHMRTLMSDSAGPDGFTLSAPTQDDLISKLKAEIISCYNDDPNLIFLDKFVKNELSFMIENSLNTQGSGVVREVIFQLSELLFPRAPENTQLRTSYGDRLIFFPKVYLEGIPASREHKELAFVRGVVTTLSIVHLSRLPRRLCILSMLLHLTYGEHELISDTILAKHHPMLASVLEEFKASGSFTAIQSIAIPYLDMDAATAGPMITSEEARAVFSQKLLLACIQGPTLVGMNDEERAFRAGLNLQCSNGFRFSELCKHYSGGWEALLDSLNTSQIQTYEDLLPVLRVVEPRRALGLLRQHSEFRGSNFKSLIEGFLQRTGWPLHSANDDPLGLTTLSSNIGYQDLSAHLEHPGFRSQLFYRCATASDSLLSGQRIQVTITDVPLGYSMGELSHNASDSGIRFQTCFGCLSIHSSVILDIIYNNPLGERLARFDNWMLATIMISLEASMGGTM
ncbi:uncharacterized protein EI90DRAFT_3151826 [Cantharellus anzutake]|uniref:uncharacterized protein n=1 Tax=Cantharellus anzutake TaxID=1750568 RepID=UPI0019055145|nr:uncharacterized protein EI90DRAFT_3151826 [Cantharellus anzutake]KAF8337988.1 hypothetical protein EI90DRAFT_3151826 [Cantharellus anzutake]